ncbi:MAG: PAS domain-containing protein, partial [Fibrella sp.]|nr:PAS domain-containing protein [Armatimonadota bacterium]
MPAAKSHLRDFVEDARNIGDASRDPMLVLSADLDVLCANRAFREAFKVATDETEGKPLALLSGGMWNSPELVTLLTDAVAKPDPSEVFSARCEIGKRVISLTGRTLPPSVSRPTLLILSAEDITA